METKQIKAVQLSGYTTSKGTTYWLSVEPIDYRDPNCIYDRIYSIQPQEPNVAYPLAAFNAFNPKYDYDSDIRALRVVISNTMAEYASIRMLRIYNPVSKKHDFFHPAVIQQQYGWRLEHYKNLASDIHNPYASYDMSDYVTLTVSTTTRPANDKIPNRKS